MTSDLLTLTDVVAGYGAVRILRGVSLRVVDGSITALVGGNGAGKTTLMNTIVGIVSPDSGAVSFERQDVTHLRPSDRVNQGIVLVPEGRLIFPQLTVEENLRVGAIAPRARPHQAESLESVYTLFPRLIERRRQYGGTLSGGEQQMLALGRGLMARPRVLLLDEPTMGLAPQVADQIFETIVELRSKGMTILIAEQETARTLSCADRGYVMENGSVVLEGTGQDLLDNPSVREAYLGI